MADYIPFDIQKNILKRLPTLSLMRFRTVSKPYKSLIDSSEFIADYSFNHTRQHHLLVTYTRYDDEEEDSLPQPYVSFVDDDTFPQQKFSLPDPVPYGDTIPQIVGSFQGLFCLRSTCVVSNRCMMNIVLWNPSIRKSISVVMADVPHQQRSGVFVGFGGRDPKIVKGYSEGPTPWQVEVYTLSTRAWRSVPSITQPRKSVVLMPNQVATDECIYWLGADGFRLTDFMPNYLIVSFDLISEKLMEVSLPDCLVTEGVDDVVLSKLQNSVVVLEVRTNAGKRTYGVWKMEHGAPNTFTKLYAINLPDAFMRFMFGFRKNCEPIFAKRTHDSVDELLSESTNSPDASIQGVLVQKLHLEHNYALISANGYNFSAFSYMETLLLLDH